MNFLFSIIPIIYLVIAVGIIVYLLRIAGRIATALEEMARAQRLIGENLSVMRFDVEKSK